MSYSYYVNPNRRAPLRDEPRTNWCALNHGLIWVILLCSGVILLRQFSSAWEENAQVDQVLSDRSSLAEAEERRNYELKTEIAHLLDPEDRGYLEVHAREKLGLMREGEVIVNTESEAIARERERERLRIIMRDGGEGQD